MGQSGAGLCSEGLQGSDCRDSAMEDDYAVLESWPGPPTL